MVNPARHLRLYTEINRTLQERVAVKDVGEKIGERKSKSAASLMIPNT
jgi:hypothetical protein